MGYSCLGQALVTNTRAIKFAKMFSKGQLQNMVINSVHLVAMIRIDAHACTKKSYNILLDIVAEVLRSHGLSFRQKLHKLIFLQKAEEV